MAEKSIFQATLKTNFGVKNRPIFALKVSKEASDKFVYFIVMKHFGFIILKQSVCMILNGQMFDV